jgi:rRNA maturation endonuclease Nob1
MYLHATAKLGLERARRLAIAAGVMPYSTSAGSEVWIGRCPDCGRDREHLFPWHICPSCGQNRPSLS